MMDRFKFLLAMIPTILQMVIAVEHAFPGAKQGPNKFDTVVGTVGAAAAGVPAVVTAFEGHDLQGAIGGIAQAAVDGLKAGGVLTQPSAVVQPTTTTTTTTTTAH